ncbi:MAG: hypothetical protein K2Q06_12070, partial [Parvularculaceae bacterium]|nr:hypothetical protein [Parvularculaceae bacterium]
MKSLISAVKSSAGPNAAATPWYVDLFLAVGGWVAGLLAALAIFAFGFAVFSTPDVGAGWIAVIAGLAFVAGGAWFGRGGPFRRQFGVAIVAAGLTAFVGGLLWVLFEAFDKPDERVVGALLLGVSLAQAVVAWLAARVLKERTLTFLATLAWFGLAAGGAVLLFRAQDFGAAPFRGCAAAA